MKHMTSRDPFRCHSSGAPLLFESAKRQRALAFLAHNGPSRPAQIANAIGANNLEGFDSLVKTGIVVWDKRSRTRTIVALNEKFPGVEHMVQMLRLLEPRISFPTGSFASEQRPRSLRTKAVPNLIFGGSGTDARMRVLICLDVLGGRAESRDIAYTLGRIQRSVIRRLLDRLASEGFLLREPGSLCYRFRKQPWTPHLRRFLRTINQNLSIQRRTARTFEYGSGRIKVLDYRKPVIGQSKPRTFRPNADGCPLLFTTDAKRRVLCGLASGAPVRISHLSHFAEIVEQRVYHDLEKHGLIIRFGTRAKRFVALHPHLVGREHFLRLLRNLYGSFMSDRPLPPIATVTLPKTKRWNFKPLQLLGRWQQTEVLLLLGLTKELDLTRLCDALVYKHPATQTIMRCLYKLRHQQVIRHRTHGLLVMYSLNPHFVGAHELRRFLRAVTSEYPQYAASIKNLKFVSTDRARRLRNSSRATVAFPPAIDSRFPAQ